MLCARRREDPLDAVLDWLRTGVLADLLAEREARAADRDAVRHAAARAARDSRRRGSKSRVSLRSEEHRGHAVPQGPDPGVERRRGRPADRVARHGGGARSTRSGPQDPRRQLGGVREGSHAGERVQGDGDSPEEALFDLPNRLQTLL
jgi:hypothetical protein